MTDYTKCPKCGMPMPIYKEVVRDGRVLARCHYCGCVRYVKAGRDGYEEPLP